LLWNFGLKQLDRIQAWPRAAVDNHLPEIKRRRSKLNDQEENRMKRFAGLVLSLLIMGSYVGVGLAEEGTNTPPAAEQPAEKPMANANKKPMKKKAHVKKTASKKKAAAKKKKAAKVEEQKMDKMENMDKMEKAPEAAPTPEAN
jgi:outer membrane biosynthesis protein TonB